MMNEKIQMGKANIGVIEVKRIKKRVGGRIYLVNYGKVNQPERCIDHILIFIIYIYLLKCS